MNAQETNTRWSNLKYWIQYVITIAVTYFTQLSLLNFIFVLIGAVAAPVETGSLLLLYIASLFSLISFFALILKVFHNWVMKDKEQIDKENNHRCSERQDGDPEPQIVTISKTKHFFRFVCFLILVFTLAAGIGVTVSFIYIYTVLNQEYRNNRGIITFLGALLPSLLASTSGFFWTGVLPCIGKNDDQEKERRRVLDERLLQLIQLEIDQTQQRRQQATNDAQIAETQQRRQQATNDAQIAETQQRRQQATNDAQIAETQQRRSRSCDPHADTEEFVDEITPLLSASI